MPENGLTAIDIELHTQLRHDGYVHCRVPSSRHFAHHVTLQG